MGSNWIPITLPLSLTRLATYLLSSRLVTDVIRSALTSSTSLSLERTASALINEGSRVTEIRSSDAIGVSLIAMPVNCFSPLITTVPSLTDERILKSLL